MRLVDKKQPINQFGTFWSNSKINIYNHWVASYILIIKKNILESIYTKFVAGQFCFQKAQLDC